MGTVYVTQEDAFIAKIDERLNIKFDKKSILDVPLLKVDGVVIMGRASISPAAIAELIHNKIPLTFLTVNGKYIARLEPEMSKNVFLRNAQWKAAGESIQAVHVAKGFVRGKLKNYRNSLLKTQRNYRDIDTSKGISQIEASLITLEKATTVNSIRGCEGAGSAGYFGCFNDLLRVDNFTFNNRNRRPPIDPVNSLLSLGYSLLRHDVQGALNIVGFDPYLGYLHTERYGKPSLALDLMEEFRPLIVDSLVLSTINRKIFKPSDFVTEPVSNAVSLTKDKLHEFLKLYQERKLSTFKHPVLGIKKNYQETFEIQARLLGKYLMGETDKYPPLVMK